MLKNKNVAVYVTGGIAVYKAADLVRKFIKQGANVKVAMTASATEFITPLTFQILSKHPVSTDTFDERENDKVNHIHLADWTDIAVVAPATANVIAKIANGIADDFVTTALLATKSPIIVVPAMNQHMLENPATVRNLELLEKDGKYVLEPDTGFLAEGYEGKGRFPEPDKIIENIKHYLTAKNPDLPFSGKKIIVTAGGTRERIDPVRFITNDSSGKMGYNLAAAARDMGAEVTLISAATFLPVPYGVTFREVESAFDMQKEVEKIYASADIVIMAAAVSDYQPSNAAKEKIKKQSPTLELTLSKTTDILALLGQKKQQQFLIGFAAETTNLENYAQEKLKKKNADMIVANDVSSQYAGFNKDTNEVTIFTSDAEPVKLSVRSKYDIALEILFETLKKMNTVQ